MYIPIVHLSPPSKTLCFFEKKAQPGNDKGQVLTPTSSTGTPLFASHFSLSQTKGVYENIKLPSSLRYVVLRAARWLTCLVSQSAFLRERLKTVVKTSRRSWFYKWIPRRRRTASYFWRAESQHERHHFRFLYLHSSICWVVEMQPQDIKPWAYCPMGRSIWKSVFARPFLETARHMF